MKEKRVFPDPGDTDLNLYRCGIEDCAPGHAWGPGVRDHYQIHVVLGGSGTFRNADRSFPLAGGDAFLILPGAVVSYRADAEAPWSYAWVGFHGLKAEALLRDAGLSARNPVFRVEEPGRFADLVRRLLAAAGRGRGRDALALGLLYQFLAEVAARPGAEPEEPGGGRREEHLRRAVADVATSFAGPLTVTELARRAGLDRSYLYSLFMERLGVSPKDYIARLRIERACALLASPLTVAEVARSVGFEDAQVFTRTFRRLKGVPPSAFRKGAAPTADGAPGTPATPDPAPPVRRPDPGMLS